MISHPYDARFEAARATDQSGQRGWYFPPASAEPARRFSFGVVTAVQFGVVALVVALVWGVMS